MAKELVNVYSIRYVQLALCMTVILSFSVLYACHHGKCVM